MVRELFQLARSKKACIVFFDEIDAIGGARFDDGAGSDNEVQRTMLQIVTELDGFDARGNVKILMATNRYDGIVWTVMQWPLSSIGSRVQARHARRCADASRTA